MARDLNVNPYYDDSVEQAAKLYKEVLFVPDKAVQARELTESQTLSHEQRRLNWDSMYKNGSVVDGCDLAIAVNIPTGAATANLPAGKFYFEGRILAVPTQSLIIVGTGIENIGLYVEETFIDYSIDTTLTDPASGFTNYGLDGAHRLKIDVKLVKVIDVPIGTRPTLPATQKYADDVNVVLLWDLSDGIIQNYLRKPDYSVLSKVLAKRTYDESGNYLVEGMNLKAELSTTVGKIKVVVCPGVCYVKGFDNTTIVPKSTLVDKALTTKDYELEPHTFDNAVATYQLFHPYVVDNPSVKIVDITAIVAQSITVTRGSGNYDTFEDTYGTTYSSIESIVAISGYVQGVDFELETDQIHWLAGSRPSVGTDYDVDFQYYKNSVRDVDFTVDLDLADTEGNVYNITWLGVDDPVDATIFLVDYSIYEARTDLFAIDKFGKIVVKAGSPTQYDKTVVPPYNEECLPLGWIKFMPGLDYDNCKIYEYNFRRTTMYELHYLKKRVNYLEENLAALALEGEAKEGELATNLKGIFVDPFNTLYKADLAHTDYYASTNLLDGELYMVSLSMTEVLNRVLDTDVTLTRWANKESINKLITLQHLSDVAFFENTLKTELMNLNPHGYIKNMPYATLDPSGDEWIDTKIVETTIIENEIVKTTTDYHQLQWVSNPTNDTSFSKERRDQIGTNISQGRTSVKDDLIAYTRRKTITIKGYNFEPAGFLGATFGGKDATLVAVSPYRQGTGANAAKVITAADGSFQATFYIPADVETGNIELKLTDEFNNTFTAIYKAKGISRLITNRTVVTTTFEQQIDIFEIVKPPVTPDPIPVVITHGKPEREDVTRDPLAQSFVFAEDHMLTALGFYFGTKADDTAKPMVQDDFYNYTGFKPISPAVLTIGYMVNGLPDSKNVIHMQEIGPDEITTSPYGTVETKISLKKPVFIPAMKEFYISIGSKSTEYTVFVARLGQVDIDSGNTVMKNPYQDGVLFTSSNGLTWTAAQDIDMTLKLYEGNFAATGLFTTENVQFPITPTGETIPWTGFGRFLFINNFNEMPYSNAEFSYSLDGGTIWKIFNPSDEIDTGSASTQLKIKCSMVGNGKSTPIVEVATALIFFKYDVSQTGQYRTKVVAEVPAYNNMKIILDEYIVSGTNIIKEFSPSDDTTLWFRLVHDAIEETDIGGGFYRKTYEFNLDLLQCLTVADETGFAVGDTIYGSDPYDAYNVDSGKIVAIETLTHKVYVMLNDDTTDRFEVGNDLENGVVSSAISVVDDYTSEPTWFVNMTGRLLLESTNYWRSPVVKNYRMVAVGK